MSQLELGIDYYFNEDGLMVLTEKYLSDRGHCCGNLCKHCPYIPKWRGKSSIVNCRTKLSRTAAAKMSKEVHHQLEIIKAKE